MNVKHFFLILLITNSLPGCISFLKMPPIPNDSIDVSRELKYIYKTDQKDRRQNLLRFIFTPEEKKMQNNKLIAVSDRDSIRLTRVIDLYDKNLIKTYEDKFNAAFIYLHGGGIKLTKDSLYMRISYSLFKDTYENSDIKKLKRRAEPLMNQAYYRWQ